MLAVEPTKLADYFEEGGQDAEPVTISQVSERNGIHYAFHVPSWDRYDLGDGVLSFGIKPPDRSHLFNFDVPIGKLGNLLVLDNYGDEILSSRIRQKIFGTKTDRETIGIFRDSGEIVRVAFNSNERRPVSLDVDAANGCSLLFYSFAPPIFMPPSMRGSLDELKSAKRPFRFTLPDYVLFEFFERWAS